MGMLADERIATRPRQGIDLPEDVARGGIRVRDLGAATRPYDRP